MAEKLEKKYPARCIECWKMFEVPYEYSAFYGVQTRYSCPDCRKNKRKAKKEAEKARLEQQNAAIETQIKTAQLKLEEEKERTRQRELELKKAETLERGKTKQRELELKNAEILEKEKTKQRELDEKKAHWEQMRADIQSKVSTEQLRMKATLAEAQKKQAESAQQAIQEFRNLKDEGVGVTNRDLTSLLHSIPQPRGYEQEHIPGRRPKIWTAPVKTLPEEDESSDQ